MKQPLAAIGGLAWLSFSGGLAPPAAPQVFRAGVDVVQVDAIVSSDGRPVVDLTARDFAITDNGVPQTVLDVTRETVPIDVSLILDTSATGGSMFRNSVINATLAAAINQIRERLRPDDRVALTTFARGVLEHLPLSPASALAKLNLKATSPMVLDPGDTSLYDALALSLPITPVPGRRQLAVLFSASKDTASFLDEPTTFDVVRRSSAAIFVVGSTVDPNPIPTANVDPAAPAYKRDYLLGSRPLPEAFLKRIAAETGGRLEILEPAVYTANSPQRVGIRIRRVSLEEKFVGALDDFRAGYVLRYTPTGVARGGWHQLSVTVTRSGGFNVAARRGYAGVEPRR